LQDDGKVDRKKYVDEHSPYCGSCEHEDNSDLWATRPPRHLKLEEYIKNGGRIVSEHPNIRGEDYHTVVVELPDGHRQAFANVKKETLEKILTEQNAQDRAAPEQREQGKAQQTQPGQYGRRSRHLSLEDYLQQGGKIVSEHPNIRGEGYHTVVVELPNGGRQAFANVKSETLEKILAEQQAQGKQSVQLREEEEKKEYRYGTTPEKHLALEDYIKQGARIISEHPNIRGEEYHTVVVEFPNGRRQAFANVKHETLEKILAQQSQGRGAEFTRQEEPILQENQVLQDQPDYQQPGAR
jgi:hypothetical protein